MYLSRHLLTVIAAISGALLLTRAFLGPFHLFVEINNPLTLQCVFALAATLALAAATSRTRTTDQSRSLPPLESGSRPMLLGVTAILLIGLLAFAQSLSMFFLSDDLYLVSLAASWSNGYPSELFKHGGGTEFFRPLGGIALMLTSLMAGFNPLLWHIGNLVLHLMNSVLLFLLATRLTRDRRAAFLAAVLFTLHGTRPEAVTWVAGRFELISCLFVLIGLMSFVRYWETRRSSYYAAALFAMTLGMLSKESAFVFPMLAGLTLLLLPDTSLRSLLWTAPFYAGAVAIFAVRWLALGGLGGYASANSIEPTLISRTFQVVKALMLRIWPPLYFPLNWSVEPEPYVVVSIAIAVVATVYLLTTVSMRRRHVLFSLAFVIISCLPAISQLLIGSDLQKSRLLYIASIGFCLLLGCAVSAIQSRAAAASVALALLLFHLACLQHNLSIWRRVASLAESTCSKIVDERPPSTNKVVIRRMPGSIDGVYFLRNGVKACLDLKSRQVLNLEVDDTGARELGKATAVFEWNHLTNSLVKTSQ